MTTATPTHTPARHESNQLLRMLTLERARVADMEREFETLDETNPENLSRCTTMLNELERTKARVARLQRLHAAATVA